MDPDVTAAAQAAPPERLGAAPAAIGAVVHGRWSVREVHSGGQAWVLIVTDLESGTDRAIKIPFSDLLAGDAEIVALLGIDPYPHVVTALEITEVQGRTAIVEEYVPSSLAEVLRGSGDRARSYWRIPRPEVVQEICDGMAYLSEQGEFAHLDLKPSNVLLDRAGVAKVADFGLAGAVQIRNGRFPAARGGTWAYAAPEVLRLEPADSRADIFSFGLLLYQLCTGELPYPFALAPTPAEQRAQLLDYYDSGGPAKRCEELYYCDQIASTQVPVPPPDVPMGAIISDCLQPYPGRRPRSFRALAAQLDRDLGLPIVEARPEPLAQIDRQRRVLARSQALIRLARPDEAVQALNRVLRGPIEAALLSDVLDAAESALTAAGRPADAATLLRRFQ